MKKILIIILISLSIVVLTKVYFSKSLFSDNETLKDNSITTAADFESTQRTTLTVLNISPSPIIIPSPTPEPSLTSTPLPTILPTPELSPEQ